MIRPIRILISGIRGNIARAFKAHMMREYPEVGIADLMPFPFSLQSLSDALRGGSYTHFINCASLGDDSASKTDPYSFFDTNVAGVYRQLEMVRRYSPHTRYLNLGTIYEDAEEASPYVASKRAAREVVTSYRINHDIYALTATLGFTEYDGRADTYLSRRITKGVAEIAVALRDGWQFEPLQLRDVEQRFSWTWADDVADGMWRMLNQDAPCDYTLSSAETHSVREFMETSFAAAGVPGVWWHNFDSNPEYLLGDGRGLATKAYCPLVRTQVTAGGSAPISNGGDTKAFSELGWQPKVSFQEIVTRMTKLDCAAVGITL